MFWTNVSDTVIHYKIYGSPELPPALLIHELGGSCESWDLLAPHVSNRALYAIDLRGAGASEKPLGPYSIGMLAEDALAFMAAVRPQEQWDMAGSALGAFVAAEAAARNPDLIGRLAMSAVVAEIDGQTHDYLADRARRIAIDGLASVTEATLKNSFPEGTPSPDDSFRQHYEMLYRCQDPASYSALSLALARYSPPPRLLEHLTMPTLVLAGARDFIWPMPRVREVAARITDCRFVELADAGHFPHIHDPRRYGEALSSFWGQG